MDDLIAFIRSCLDDDERAARAAAVLPYGSAKWFAGAEGSVFGIDQGSDMHVRGAVLSLDDIGEHIARWDPARVLAEIDAKRKLLDLHAPFKSNWHRGVLQCDHCAELCHSRSGLGCDSPDAPYPCPTVRLIALPYADRPGYLEEWRPSTG